LGFILPFPLNQFERVSSFYLRKFSRRIILIKGFLTILPLLSFFWLITIIRKMATPPLLNLIAEIICICSTLAIDFECSLNSFIGILGGAYSMVLYSRTQQPRFFRIWSHSSSSALPERILLFTQLGWLFLLVLSLDLLF
jgi:NADH:ubiquinone oxidoreductase subunit 4 (subunit M)